MSDFLHKTLLAALMNAVKEACAELKYEDGKGDARVLLEDALLYVQRKLDESTMVPLFNEVEDGEIR
jgi:hypothetical protein